MDKNKQSSGGLSYTTKYVLLFSALLLAANIILGSVILTQSVSTVRRMVRKDMLNMSNTAASLIDGDVIRGFDEEDKGTEAYEYVLSELSAFQENTDIKYIYLVKQVGDEHFIFIVDADPDDPADFGEEVLITDALRSAAKGSAMVDNEPAQDEWGNFYSSYSPVFDSGGEIAGIVGVDFDADWYDKQILENSASIGIVSAISFLVTLTVLLIVTGNIRKKFRELNEDLVILASDVEELAKDLDNDTGYKRSDERKSEDESEAVTDISAAELEALSGKIRSMHTDIKAYIDFVHEKALTDALTNIGNTAAYMERVAGLEEAIADGSADFHLILFDINYLKHLNDKFGHMCGDRVISGTAEVIARVFGVKNTFRIGGDEFAAIAEGVTDDDMASMMARFDKEVILYNEEHRESDGELSVSKGQASYIKGEDKTYRSVFSRADKNMYQNKTELHKIDLSRERKY